MHRTMALQMMKDEDGLFMFKHIIGRNSEKRKNYLKNMCET